MSRVVRAIARNIAYFVFFALAAASAAASFSSRASSISSNLCMISPVLVYGRNLEDTLKLPNGHALEIGRYYVIKRIVARTGE